MLLDDDEEEVLVGRDEDFLFFAADPEEGQVVHRVDVAHHRPRLLRQVRYFLSVQLRGSVVA